MHLPRFIAHADLAVIDGKLDLAALRLDRARRALDDCLEYRLQGCSLRCLLHHSLDLLVRDLSKVGLVALEQGLQLDQVGGAAVDMLIGPHRLQPAAVLSSQPQ